MDIDDYRVRRRGYIELERIAAQWREALNRFFVAKNLDILEMFSEVNAHCERKFEVVVRPDAEMGRANAYVSSDSAKLFIRKSLITRALDGDRSAIFDAVHELGHLVLHREGLPHARMVDGNVKQTNIDELSSSEFQANYFTRAFLMTIDEVNQFTSIEELSAECHVFEVHAELRVTEVARLPESVRSNTLCAPSRPKNALVSAGYSRRTSNSVLPPDVAKKVAWGTTEEIDGLDPSEYRLFEERWTIRWSRFGMEAAGGWTLDQSGYVVPWEKERLT